MPDISVFKRYEKKYRMDEAQYQGFMKAMEPYMQLDEYGETTIMSIYYDTDHYDLIRKSLEQPVYKEKLRMRSYGVPKGNEKVFVELKKKYEGIVYKRRESMLLEEAQRFLSDGTMPKRPTQILKEIDYCRSYYDLKPKAMILCERCAYFDRSGNGLRLTIDKDIRARENDLDFRKGADGKKLLDEKPYLMEIKIADAMPLWMSNAMTRLNIVPHRFSKYGTFYTEKRKGVNFNV